MGEAIILHRVQEWNPVYEWDGAASDCVFTDEGNGNWNIEFLSSGTFTFIHPNSARRGIDVFLVGGGGGCANTTNAVYQSDTEYGARSGGGGGYTKTVTNISITRRTPYTITVGAGGRANDTAPGSGWVYGADGGNSSASFDVECIAAGGKGGRSRRYNSNYTSTPGAGGSGGAGGVGYGWGTVDGNFPTPATNGANGSMIGGSGNGGAGQGTTTGEFGDPNATKYSAGGGRGTVVSSNTGNGGFSVCAEWEVASTPACNGASGIVIIRNYRE